MNAPSFLRNVLAFVQGFLARDRYLTEALAALVTFGMGVFSSFTLDQIQSRSSLAGFRDMPSPEFWVSLFAFPGIWCAAKLIKEGEREEGWVSLGVMSSFYGLCLFSVLIDLTNWGFWTLFCLLLGLMKGYALVREWTYLRWSVTILGCFFWTNFTISLWQNLPAGLYLLITPCLGFSAANLLSVSRLSGTRRHG